MNRPDHCIVIVPYGSEILEYLADVAESIQEQFGLPIRIEEDRGIPEFALDPLRQQYNSNLMLKELVGSCPPGGLKILGVTAVDLFSPIFSYVFGEAQFNGCGAVVSSYRLRGNGAAPEQNGCPPLVSRLEKECLHELGHTFGLRHCSDPDCLMHFSVGIECADRKFAFFCPACRDLMLWHMAGDLFLKLH
jgi:archaemetzincin